MNIHNQTRRVFVEAFRLSIASPSPPHHFDRRLGLMSGEDFKPFRPEFGSQRTDPTGSNRVKQPQLSFKLAAPMRPRFCRPRICKSSPYLLARGRQLLRISFHCSDVVNVMYFCQVRFFKQWTGMGLYKLYFMLGLIDHQFEVSITTFLELLGFFGSQVDYYRCLRNQITWNCHGIALVHMDH